jgi:hypothetical protein
VNSVCLRCGGADLPSESPSASEATPHRDSGPRHPYGVNGRNSPLTLADPLMMTDLEEREGMAVIGHRTTCRQLEPADVVTFGAFQFAGHVPVGEIADFYGLPVAQAEKVRPVGTSLLIVWRPSQQWATPSG